MRRMIDRIDTQPLPALEKVLKQKPTLSKLAEALEVSYAELIEKDV